MGDCSWTGLQPHGMQEVIAEMKLINFLYAKECWDKVNDAWRASLLPEGKLLLRSDGYSPSRFLSLPEIRHLITRQCDQGSALRDAIGFNLLCQVGRSGAGWWVVGGQRVV